VAEQNNSSVEKEKEWQCPIERFGRERVYNRKGSVHNKRK